MVLKSNTEIGMDIVRLTTEIHQKAKEYLDEVNESNLKDFAESTKLIALSVLENYYLAIDNHYTHGMGKISNEDMLDKFIDFQNGYRSLMKNWISEHEIKIEDMKIASSTPFPTITNEDIKKECLIIAGTGTLIAVGLYIFTNIWIAVAAELLLLGMIAYRYKKKIEECEEEHKAKVRRYELEIEKEKALLVNGLINDIKKWLSAAEEHSNELLNNFGIR